MSLFNDLPNAPKAKRVDIAEFGYKKYTVCLTHGTGYKSKCYITVPATNEQRVHRHPEVRKFLREFPEGTVEITNVQ